MIDTREKIEEQLKGKPAYISIEEASTLMETSQQNIRFGLQQGKFSQIGEAIKHPREYRYYINRRRLLLWLAGEI